MRDNENASTTSVNATMTKFGYPATTIVEHDHWVVLLRPAQATLGALVLACKGEFQAFPDIPAAAFTELARVTREIEDTLAELFAFDRVNYLMLRMIDPHVHFHVIPRYGSLRLYAGVEFRDDGWPGPPNLSASTDIDADTSAGLLAVLRGAWPEKIS